MGKKESRYSRHRMDTGQHHRILLVMLLLGLLAFVPVGIRLGILMIRDYDYYARLARQNQSRTTHVAADRGDILDRNMNILATNVGVENVYLDPHELKQSGADIPAIAAFLGEILNQDPAWIREQESGPISMKTTFPASIWSPPPEGPIPMVPWRPRSSALPMRSWRAVKASRQPVTNIFPGVRERSSPPRAAMKWICPFPMKTIFPTSRAAM